MTSASSFFYAIIVFCCSADINHDGQEASANALGYITSKAGRLLRNGAAFGTSEKLEVAEKVTFLLERDGEIPSTRMVAKEAKVSWRFANKVINKVLAHGNVLESKKRAKRAKHLPGSRTSQIVDEKMLKGAEVFNRKARADPLTGIVPESVVNPDFRNTYSII